MIRRLFKKDGDDSLEELVTLAQDGDEEAQNHLLKQYQPFIAKSVSEVCKRYIDPSKDDEFSIGLMAFHEAIQSYSREKGSSFLSFAKLVVKRKVIDYIRNDQNNPVVASIDQEYDDEEQMENPQEVKAARDRYDLETESWYRRIEIHDFTEKLKTYKLSFEELTTVSPKHRDARESAIKVARTIYNDDQLRDFVLEKRKLPMKLLADKVEVSKKTLERNRKFILAIFIILHEDYVYLKDYIRGVGL
ncbi:RNA polymerase sigma-I factor [Pontibacillus yanchengensis]|uniref:RNA polymerase sigma factor SigI n=1 Tax=Pontibacillus yanchengensis Y32 TaxID=1385514 RepID=A0A0A2TF79_9BACI|nr:RNA polymerase sigma-I factor [Pontibacillus yanchengensis]KGP73088.1 RNA polymerase sigma factor SigI [Pontibacillus yanchengensis Y32]